MNEIPTSAKTAEAEEQCAESAAVTDNGRKGLRPNASNVVEIPYIPPAELRGNSRAHWAKKRKLAREMHDSAFTSFLGSLWRPHRIRLTFEFHHWRKVDLDNLAIGMKAWVDGLVWILELPSDDPDHVTYGEHRFVKCAKGESKTVIAIQDILDEE